MMLGILFTLFLPLACHPVHTDWILGKDLAVAVPALAGLPADLQIGLAPIPGQQRTFQIPDLRRIASAHHLAGDPKEPVCFAWTLAPPMKETMLAAMEKTLAGRKARIEVVETSLSPLPSGEIIFSLDGLGSPASDKAVLWRGYVRYAERRRFPLWARVMITVSEPHLVAATALHPGDVLDASQLRVENYDGPVRRERYLADIAQATGRLLRCPVSEGAPLLESMLDIPREVNRGDLVNAIVQNGGAHLEVQGVAEECGRKGQVITIRNPRSGRSFHARVEEKGTVVVVPGGQSGLVVETKKS